MGGRDGGGKNSVNVSEVFSVGFYCSSSFLLCFLMDKKKNIIQHKTAYYSKSLKNSYQNKQNKTKQI